jgi:hypothetical protein
MRSVDGKHADEPGRADSGRSQSASGASAADLYAAVRADFAGLEEVCRWQWNLIQRLRSHLDLLPERWPDGKDRPS